MKQKKKLNLSTKEKKTKLTKRDDAGVTLKKSDLDGEQQPESSGVIIQIGHIPRDFVGISCSPSFFPFFLSGEGNS